MTLREHQNRMTKYVNFANGFPCKEMVPTHEPSPGLNVRGGFFVGLHDGATSCLTRTQKMVPPLAKRRVNSFALKPRASSSRYVNKKDPFGGHKGTEKLGFSPQAIKQSKPKVERITRTEPLSSNSAFIDKTLLRPRVARPPEQWMSSPTESDSGAKTTDRFSTNVILSDMEKQKTLNELIGIDEVYQRVCNGNLSSLSSLIKPGKSKKKFKQSHSGISSAQYIQTSAPLSLRQKHTPRSPPIVGLSNETVGTTGDKSLSNNTNMTKITHSVLVPLPYFHNSKPPNTAPARLKENYTQPKVYTSRLDNSKQRSSGVLSSMSGWSSPAIINVNPIVDMSIIKRPVSRACAPTGSIIGVQNKSHTGKVAIVAALDATATPPATAESEAVHQGLFEEESKHFEQNTKSPDEDSLFSEELASNKLDPNIRIKEQSLLAGKTENSLVDEDIFKDKNLTKEIKGYASDYSTLAMEFSCTVNVTDESGQINEAEIYDPNSRDLEQEEKVNKNVEEAQQNYQKKRQELESLLDEHKTLVQEVNHVTNEEQN